MFGIGGEHDLSERELPISGAGGTARRCGWATAPGSSPNSTCTASCSTPPPGSPISWWRPARRPDRFFVDLADAAASRWRDKDQGIWEVRGEARDFLYSKLMCWVALDRAVGLAGVLGAEARVEAWTRTREEIAAAILTEGWSETAGAFTQSFGSDALDASNLMMPIVGFLPAGDPRMRATIEATAAQLTDDRGLVYRYRAHDGLEGEEGTFLLCTFWLAQALALAGETARARATFERAIAFANDVGLLAEEVDPRDRGAARQLSAGVQPHRPGQRRLGPGHRRPEGVSGQTDAARRPRPAWVGGTRRG